MADQKTTYASLALTEDDHQAYEDAFRDQKAFWRYQPQASLVPSIAGQYRAFFMNRNPSFPSHVLAFTPDSDANDVDAAVQNARRACRALERLGWDGRIKILKRASAIIEERFHRLAALLTLEIGKTRAEAIAEVREVQAMVAAYDTFIRDTSEYSYILDKGIDSPFERSVCVQRPLGGPVAVIVPFNFPFALAANQSMAAILAGNPVIFKPSEDAPLSTLEWRTILVEAGLPEEACPVVFGQGETTGEALITHPDISCVAFTGSLETGKRIMKAHAELFESGVWRASPVMEMGGKNPVVVTRHADIATAAEGILRAVVGFGGQKCSATSRVYAERAVYNNLRDVLIYMAENGLPNGAKIIVGRPEERRTYLGPLVNETAANRYVRLLGDMRRIPGIQAAFLVDRDHRDIHHLCETSGGHFARPVLIEGLAHEHPLNKLEHFVPIVSLMQVESLEDGVRKANDAEQGLCAGIYSKDSGEQDYFEENIESGMVYINRPGGATTGSWPTVQNFGGWKGSSTSGVGAFGKWYLLRFTREQDRTRVLRRM